MFSSPPDPPSEPSIGEDTKHHEPRLLTRRESPTETSQHRQLFSRLTSLRRAQSRRERTPGVRRVLWRRFFLTLCVLLLLTVAVLLTTTLWLRHEMRAALPQIDGQSRVTGLSAPVTITRDAQGVPMIRAASLDDLLFAQGFVTAQDRLWQMDALRRHAGGELAEILGPSLIAHDRLQRTLQMRAAADRAVLVLPAAQVRQLEAYARGVNAYVEANRDHLPVEFHLLHYKPAAWTPRDSLLVSLVMWQDLSTEYPQKLRREVLAAHLPASLLADLYPVGSWRDHPPTQAPPDLSAPHESIDQIPLDESQSANRAPALPFASPQDLLKSFGTLENHCDDCRSGSNNWAVSGSRSASGAPLLSNDMHLSLSVPDIWYEATLHTTGPTPVDATGFTLPGVPWLIVGRNAHVAWGFTNLGGDVQDVRIEHLRGTGPHTEFEQADGGWSPVGHHAEHIRVRGGRDVTLDVQTTAQQVGNFTMPTPIISPLYPSEHRALSLAWTTYDPSLVTGPFFAANMAADGTQLVAAFSGFGGPSLNLIYADDHHIGYHAIGRIPIRGPAVHRPKISQQIIAAAPEVSTADETAGNVASPVSPAPAVVGFTIGSPISPVPVDTLNPQQQWSGYVPYNELPYLVDAPSGVLATANARITPADYPYALANDWIDPYRAEHLYHLLEGRTRLTPADMLAIQNDVHSDFDVFIAQRLAYALDHASPAAFAHEECRLRQAGDILRSWNGDVSPKAAAPAIVAAVRAALWPMLLAAAIRAHDGPHAKDSEINALSALYTWGEKNTALELLLTHTPARWLPAEYKDWNDLLTVALARALKHADAPGNLASWQYGQAHQIEIAHPIFGSHSLWSRVLGLPTGTGLQPIGGDATTIKATGLHFGPSERFTADLANAEATYGNITTGQSENPASAWYLDQFFPWLKGSTFALPLERSNAVHTLVLLPN